MATLPGYYTIDEAAVVLGCDHSTVARYIRQQRLPATDLGKQKLIEQSVVHGFERPRPGNPAWRKKS